MNKKTKKIIKYGGLTTAVVAVVVATVIALNITLTTLDAAFGLSLDFSQAGLTEIDQISKDFLKTLNKDIEIIINGSEEEFKKATGDTVTVTDKESGSEANQTVVSGKRYTYEVVDSYRKNSDKISTYYIDVRYNPGFFKDRNITFKSDDFIIIYCPENGRYFSIPNDIFSDYTLISLERRIAAGIYNTTKDNLRRVAIVTGHNEQNAAYPYISELLTNNAYLVETLDITSVEQIDGDIDILVVISPQLTYNTNDILKLRKYMSGGENLGRNLVVFTDTETPGNPFLEDFLSTEWGLQVGPDVVYDPANSSTVLNTTEPFLKVAYPSNSVAQAAADNLYEQNAYQFLSLGKTRNIIRSFEKKNAVQTAALLSTFDGNSFGRPISKNIVASDDFKNVTKQAGDTTGPLNVAAMSYIQKSDDTDNVYGLYSSNVVLFGSTSILDTRYMANMTGTTQSSAEYILSLFEFLVNEDNVIKITATSLTSSSISFQSDVSAYVTIGIIVCLVPVICAVFAIIKWRQRKYL
ncbi:MAG: hypothetical protein DBX47_03115 [Clostridiales bacterium]|nr:MAG: hypothetical protein DBX47_03115 [Clostridiales bacterium]